MLWFKIHGMKFLKSLFGSKEQPIKTNQDFWRWFSSNSNKFHKIFESKKNINEDFMEILAEKLNELRPGYYFLIGMPDDKTIELILTADGVIRNIPYVEQLVEDAPKIEGWDIIALKQGDPQSNAGIEMHDLKFDQENITFSEETDANYPDEVILTFYHPDYNESSSQEIIGGIFIYLDILIGELNNVTLLDEVNFANSKDCNEPIPVTKLGEYLKWRESEFLEKYEGLRYDTDNDDYSGYEAVNPETRKTVIGVFNTNLLSWDSKASHPWILILTIEYEAEGESGFPNQDDYVAINELEDNLNYVLKDAEGYLNIGRKTYDGSRDIFYACKDFRKPCLETDKLISKTSDFKMHYEIFKDKYWRCLEHFTNAMNNT